MNTRAVETLGPTETRMLHQAVWFGIHMVTSLVAWGLLMLAITLIFHPPFVPPAVILALSFIFPMLVAFLGAKLRPSETATLTWMAGLIWFMAWGLYVLDLPTGPTACYHCGATQKLWLTFFSLKEDSGLLDGQGRFLATWPAVAMIGYAIGAKLGLRNVDLPFERG